MASGYVDGQPVNVPCHFLLDQFCGYMFQNVGLAPGTCCQQLFEEYTRNRSSICGKHAWRTMGHPLHLIPISPASINQVSAAGPSPYMPMGLTTSTAGPSFGLGPAVVTLQQQNPVGPSAAFFVPVPGNWSPAPYTAGFLPGQAESGLGVDNLQNFAGLDVFGATRQHTGPHTRRRDDRAASDIHMPIIFEGDSSSGDVRHRHTNNGHTSSGINLLNGRLPTIAANEAPPNDWAITFGMEDDGLLDPAVYARQAPMTRRHVEHNVIRPEMAELLNGTTALTTPPNGRFGAIGSEIRVTT